MELSTIRILITDSIHEYFIEAMRQYGCEVCYEPEIQRADVLSIIHQYDVLLVNSRIQADSELLQAAARLKAVARIGSGMEVIDTQFASEKNIACFNAPEGNKDAVAEHALGMLLCLFRNIHIANAEVKNGIWLREKNRGIELGGKVVGIVGYGNNGSAFAEKLKGFNVRILAYDKYVSRFGNEYVKETDMNEIFSEADILSLHVPLTSETAFMVNDQFITRFRKPFYLINMSRGMIIHTDALITHLQSGKILGACLDVLENEKLGSLTAQQQEAFRKLQQMHNVMLTPHIAGWTHESKLKIARVLADKLTRFLSALPK
jgi:D-3-phosphoglycerate dehydrogenase